MCSEVLRAAESTLPALFTKGGARTGLLTDAVVKVDVFVVVLIVACV